MLAWGKIFKGGGGQGPTARTESVNVCRAERVHSSHYTLLSLAVAQSMWKALGGDGCMEIGGAFQSRATSINAVVTCSIFNSHCIIPMEFPLI